jgi:cobalamin synthase
MAETNANARLEAFCDAVIVIQAIGWIFLCDTALKNQLTKNEKSTMQMQVNRRNGYYSVTVYSMLAIIAFWFPLTIAFITVLLWIFWLIFGIRIKND